MQPPHLDFLNMLNAFRLPCLQLNSTPFFNTLSAFSCPFLTCKFWRASYLSSLDIICARLSPHHSFTNIDLPRPSYASRHTCVTVVRTAIRHLAAACLAYQPLSRDCATRTTQIHEQRRYAFPGRVADTEWSAIEISSARSQQEKGQRPTEAMAIRSSIMDNVYTHRPLLP